MLREEQVDKYEYNQARKEERAKGSQLCEECGNKIKRENSDANYHYDLHPNSELNMLMKDYLRKFGNLRKEGKLKDKWQAEFKAEDEKQKREIRKRFNVQLPNKFVDDEPHPEPEQPKPDIDQNIQSSS